MERFDVFALAELKEELAQSLSKPLVALAFSNQYTAHPRQLVDLAREASTSVIGYLQNADEQAALLLGDKFAAVGLGPKSVAKLVAALGRFCRAKLELPSSSSKETLLESVDDFSSTLFEGYVASRERLILLEQEQLRRALVNAMESEDRAPST